MQEIYFNGDLTAEISSLLRKKTRQVTAKLFIYNYEGAKIEEITGELEGGSIQLSALGAYRRTADLSLVISNPLYVPSPHSLIWLDKQVQILVGVVDDSKNILYWFNCGYYAIQNASLQDDAKSRAMLQLHLTDHMAFLDGTLGGQIETDVYIKKLEKGMVIYDILIPVLAKLGDVDTSDISVHRAETRKVWHEFDTLPKIFSPFQAGIEIDRKPSHPLAGLHYQNGEMEIHKPAGVIGWIGYFNFDVPQNINYYTCIETEIAVWCNHPIEPGQIKFILSQDWDCATRYTSISSPYTITRSSNPNAMSNYNKFVIELNREIDLTSIMSIGIVIDDLPVAEGQPPNTTIQNSQILLRMGSWVVSDTLVLPHAMNEKAGITVYDFTRKILDQYSNIDFYYNLDNRLTIEKKYFYGEPYVWSFMDDEDYGFALSGDNYSTKLSFGDIRNAIYVQGALLQDGTQILWQFKNKLWKNTYREMLDICPEGSLQSAKYDSSTSYLSGQIVYDDSSRARTGCFICLQNCTGIPTSNRDYWKLHLEHGDIVTIDFQWERGKVYSKDDYIFYNVSGRQRGSYLSLVDNNLSEPSVENPNWQYIDSVNLLLKCFYWDESNFKHKIERTWTDLELIVNPHFSESFLSRTLKFVVSDDKIQNVQQAKLKALHALQSKSSFQEEITFSCLPLYFLQPNDTIKINLSKFGLNNVYKIANISLDLSYKGLMTITAVKVV